MSRSVLHLDLHAIAKNGWAIDAALDELFSEAAKKRVKKTEIIPGKRGGGQLMKRVKKYLDQKSVKAQYKRVEVDAKNHGRFFVVFR